MASSKLIDGYRKFRAKSFPEHEDLFRSLADGQQPEVLLLTCSDSRIVPSLLTQTLPGEVFVVRNAGNLVGKYGPTGTAEAAAVEFGIKALGIQHIVVCGHEKCGAMSAVIDPSPLAGLPAVDAWLKASGAERVPGADPTLSEQVRFNVVKQLENLRTHPAVIEGEKAGTLQLHGWVYDFVSGEVQEFQPASGKFVALGSSTADSLGAV